MTFLQLPFMHATSRVFILLSSVIKAETIKVTTGEYLSLSAEPLPHGGCIDHIVPSIFKLQLLLNNDIEVFRNELLK